MINLIICISKNIIGKKITENKKNLVFIKFFIVKFEILKCLMRGVVYNILKRLEIIKWHTLSGIIQ